MSLFDEDEMDCECCGHVGLIFNGDFDVEYPVCGAEYSLIIDEAHHIKNPNTYAYQAEQMFYNNAESIVLLTATPIQLGDRDLYVLLNLIHSDLVFDYDSFKHMSEPNPFINEAAKLIGDIESLHTFAHIINRTRRRDIGNFTLRKPETLKVSCIPEQQERFDRKDGDLYNELYFDDSPY